MGSPGRRDPVQQPVKGFLHFVEVHGKQHHPLSYNELELIFNKADSVLYWFPYPETLHKTSYYAPNSSQDFKVKYFWDKMRPQCRRNPQGLASYSFTSSLVLYM